jgi:hypothetical protein
LEYITLKNVVHSSPGRKELLHDFISLSETLAGKENALIDIETWERELFSDIAGRIAADHVLCRFIEVQSDYYNAVSEVMRAFAASGVVAE